MAVVLGRLDPPHSDSPRKPLRAELDAGIGRHEFGEVRETTVPPEAPRDEADGEHELVIGTVLRADGTPAAGATVTGRCAAHEEDVAWTFRSVATAPDGHFAIQSPCKSALWLSASLADERTLQETPVRGGVTGSILQLSRINILFGRVCNSAGRNVAGASVRVEPVAHSKCSLAGGAGNDGSFQFQLVPDGTYEVTAYHDDYQPSRRVRVQVPGDAGLPCVCRLEDGVTVRGRVLDERGEPVCDVIVKAIADEVERERFRREAADVIELFRWGARPARTNANGEFEIRSVPALFPFRLCVAGVACLPAEPSEDYFGAVSDIVVSVRRAGQLSVTVHDDIGAGVPAARVVLRREHSDGVPRRVSATRSDALGIAQFSSLEDGDYILQASRDGLTSAVSELIRVSAGGRESVALTLSEGRTAYGVARFASGAPCKRCFVRATVSDGGAQSRVGGGAKATTDDHGKFKLAGLLPECDYRVSIQQPDQAFHPGNEFTLSLGEMNVFAVTPLVNVRGEVIASDSRKLDRLAIQCMRSDDPLRPSVVTSVSLIEGRFLLQGVLPEAVSQLKLKVEGGRAIMVSLPLTHNDEVDLGLLVIPMDE